MNFTTTVPASRPVAAARTWRLSPRVSFYLLASITFSFLAGSSAPTAIYPVYQAAWGFSPVVIAEIFGIYALAVLAALLVVGRLSDHVGRRPVLLAATVAQVVAMAVFITADGVTSLLVARVIQGLSAGAAVAAVGAGLLDFDKVRGTIANAIAPIMGTASGALVGGLMVRFLPAPTDLVYAVLGVVFVVQLVGVVLMPEPITPRKGALASLKPQFAVPAKVRGPLMLAIPVLVAAWSLAGFYGSLGPALVKHMFGFDASLFGGLGLFVLAASGAVAVLLLQHQNAQTMMRLGTAGLLLGVSTVLGGLALHSPAVYFLGTAMAGMGFGAGFQGAIRMVMPLATPHERAGVLSVAFVVSYLAMGVPAIVAGFFMAHGNGISATAGEFGGVVIALAALALAGTLVRRSA
ncbi:MFS transporter [Variovorax sp. J22R133]|uniref:MFS transporter n=1 Tax=Variovorax brevis TaxID=3053503 RepID=UPI002577D6CE|nr:MFS transporter [Variovorax sp. J22R133]MDM0112657.1 MFS transporter [Variovorax sp. J22R133]